MKIEDNKIIFIDEDGKQEELQIYFTYHSEKSQKNYVYFYHEETPDELIAGVIEPDGTVSDIETDEEYDELDEVLEEYESEDEN